MNDQNTQQQAIEYCLMLLKPGFTHLFSRVQEKLLSELDIKVIASKKLSLSLREASRFMLPYQDNEYFKEDIEKHICYLASGESIAFLCSLPRAIASKEIVEQLGLFEENRGSSSCFISEFSPQDRIRNVLHCTDTEALRPLEMVFFFSQLEIIRCLP